MTAVDTNILIYACDQAHSREQQIAIDLIGGLNDGVHLWQVACEFVAAARKLSDQGFTEGQAWARLAEFLELLPLRLPTPGILEKARLMHVQQQWSYWDALLVAACLEIGARRLYTQGLPGRTPPQGLEILNPFA
jgi:predicted nucleic acid-binding protein